MESKIKYWLELAEYDLETAQAMLEKKRYIYVGFMCHQSIEKILKAYWQLSLNQIPPKTHNLAFLVEKSGLLKSLPAALNDFIDELDPLNIQCRYPEYKDQVYLKMNEDYSQNVLILTKELFLWLKQKLS